MEKTKIIKLGQFIGIILYLLLFIGLLIIQSLSLIFVSSLSVSSYIYWMIFLGWIFLIFKFRWKSSLSLLSAFILFIIAAILAIFRLNTAAETVMRVSFIGWMVGIGQALLEYRKEHDKKPS